MKSGFPNQAAAVLVSGCRHSQWSADRSCWWRCLVLRKVKLADDQTKAETRQREDDLHKDARQREDALNGNVTKLLETSAGLEKKLEPFAQLAKQFHPGMSRMRQCDESRETAEARQLS